MYMNEKFSYESQKYRFEIHTSSIWFSLIVPVCLSSWTSCIKTGHSKQPLDPNILYLPWSTICTSSNYLDFVQGSQGQWKANPGKLIFSHYYHMINMNYRWWQINLVWKFWYCFERRMLKSMEIVVVYKLHSKQKNVTLACVPMFKISVFQACFDRSDQISPSWYHCEWPLP